MGKKDKNVKKHGFKDSLDSLPDRLLINKYDVENICKTTKREGRIHIRFDFFLTVCIAMGTLIIPYSLSNNFGEWSAIYYVFLSLFLLSIPGVIINACKMWKSWKDNSLMDRITESVIEKADLTGIFLICRYHHGINNSEKLEYLTERRSNDGSFLIYLNLFDAVNSSEDIEQLELWRHDYSHDDDLRTIIESKLAKKLGVNSGLLSINYVDSYHYIKRTNIRGDEKLIKYYFFKTSFEYEIPLDSRDEFEWKSLDELKGNVTSQIYNSDVLGYLQSNISGKLEDSFSRSQERAPVKIIWNITNQCKYSCKMCATRKEQNNISEEDKDRVLHSILSVGVNRIMEIDFSGGDPLIDEAARKTIEKAVDILGNERVCVTTTGKGIEEMIAYDENYRRKLLYHCELTLEIRDDSDNSLRGEKNYSRNNLYIISKYKQYIRHLTINVPIIETDINEEELRNEIQALVSDIKGILIPHVDVLLMRLMNVGGMTNESFPTNYNPKKFIEIFKEIAGSSGVNVKLHCALRCVLDEKKGFQCNMLDTKIGIDCEGNVFACAWGGYVCERACDSPYYLGNLLNTSLKDIMEGQDCFSMKKEKSSREMRYCSVASYLSNNEGDSTCNSIFVDADPLRKEIERYKLK